MENKVKATATGIHPETGEVHHLDFDGDAVCVVVINDNGDSISAQDALVGSLDLNRAMAMVKSLTSACSHLLQELPSTVSSIIQMEMVKEILGSMDDDEQASVKAYDEGRFAK